jgi:hypothetical protein
MTQTEVPVAAWTVVADTEEYGEVMLHEYVGSMDVIRSRVMEKAIREGFSGNFVERMADLGWRVEPLFRAPIPERESILREALALAYQVYGPFDDRLLSTNSEHPTVGGYVRAALTGADPT